jgi:hypothetical protein
LNKHEERDKIINAQSYNKKIFYQMTRKQRNNKNIIVEDLYVGNTLYEGDNILKGRQFSWSQLYARGVDVLDALVFPLLSTVYELICFVLWLF